jgi:hypothetical protein
MLSQPFHSTPQNAAPIKIPELGLELTVRLPAQALGGAMTLMETVNAAGFGPPLHRHREAEVFRVMEGVYLFEVDAVVSRPRPATWSASRGALLTPSSISRIRPPGSWS